MKMANKVTGKTDTTGALTTAPMTPKSLIIVGTSANSDKATKKIFSIAGSADAAAAFGDGIVSKMVKVLISKVMYQIY